MTNIDALGDRAEQMIPWAAQLVEAVHDGGVSDVARVLAADEVRGKMNVLAVVLAAMVNPDATLRDLLGWVPPLDRPIAQPTLFALTSEADDLAAQRLAEDRRRAATNPVRVELDDNGHVVPLLRTFTRADAAALDDETLKILHGAYRRSDPSRPARLGYLEWEKRRAARRREQQQQGNQSATG